MYWLVCHVSSSMAVQFGTPRCSSARRTRKHSKCTSRFVTSNYNHETGNMTAKMGICQEMSAAFDSPSLISLHGALNR